MQQHTRYGFQRHYKVIQKLVQKVVVPSCLIDKRSVYTFVVHYIQIKFITSILISYVHVGSCSGIRSCNPPSRPSLLCATPLSELQDVGYRGIAPKDKVQGADMAYTESEFNKRMDELKALSSIAHDYQQKIDPSVQSYSWFHIHNKSDIVVNNLYECFNYIFQAHDKLIIPWLR